MRDTIINSESVLRNLLIYLAIGLVNPVFGQSYGLYFSSTEVAAEQRTGLDLSSNDYLHFDKDFGLAFDIIFRDIPDFTFGYIARIISQDGDNIDIIYDQTEGPKILIVLKQKLSKIQLPLESSTVYTDWIHIDLRFNISDDCLIVTALGKSLVEDSAGMKQDNEYKFLFGENMFGNFRTSNVAPMNLRDVCISKNQTEKYRWPLSESSGTVAMEVNHGKGLVVRNPVWLAAKHQEWEHKYSVNLKGDCKIAFDEKNGIISIIGKDKMFRYRLSDNTVSGIRYTSGQPVLTYGSQAFFNPKNGNLYTFSMEEKLLSLFNPNDTSWGYEPILRESHAALSHYNRFFLPDRNSLYIIGGYNGIKYSSSVYKLDINQGSWSEVMKSGDLFNPRYLSASGLTRNMDTVFIFGGYGSESGNPMLNPHFYFDLYSYCIHAASFHRIYNYDNDAVYYSLANSLVLDEKKRKFYVLKFDPNSTFSYLQLLRGSLDAPEWTELADKIPYRFDETRSYADLFYSQNRKELIAVSSYFSDSAEMSTVNLYTLFFPPNNPDFTIQTNETRNRVLYWFIFIIGIDLLVILSISARKKILRHYRFKGRLGKPDPQESTFFSDNLLKKTWEEEAKKGQKDKIKDSLYLFGGFQFYNHDGEEISSRFSPLLKELFLMIVLESINNGKGVSTKILIERLWWDKSSNSAKNNLSVNIGKLKNILGADYNMLLVNTSSYWKFELQKGKAQVYCDYFECWELLNKSDISRREDVIRILSIISRGKFLQNSNFEWLDSFKARISNEVVDKLLAFSEKLNLVKDADLIINIADNIFLFDMINENAMELKCRVLVSVGKHSLAKDVYAKFEREYKELYGESYSKSFNSLFE